MFSVIISSVIPLSSDNFMLLELILFVLLSAIYWCKYYFNLTFLFSMIPSVIFVFLVNTFSEFSDTSSNRFSGTFRNSLFNTFSYIFSDMFSETLSNIFVLLWYILLVIVPMIFSIKFLAILSGTCLVILFWFTPRDLLSDF